MTQKKSAQTTNITQLLTQTRVAICLNSNVHHSFRREYEIIKFLRQSLSHRILASLKTKTKVQMTTALTTKLRIINLLAIQQHNINHIRVTLTNLQMYLGLG